MKKPPDEFGPAGRRLRDAAQAHFSFDAAEAELLRTACRLVDQLDRLTEALDGADIMVQGSTGQPRPNPLFEEMRKHSETLAKVVAALGLPKDTAARSPSELGEHAAMERWRKTGTRRT